VTVAQIAIAPSHWAMRMCSDARPSRPLAGWFGASAAATLHLLPRDTRLHGGPRAIHLSQLRAHANAPGAGCRGVCCRVLRRSTRPLLGRLLSRRAQPIRPGVRLYTLQGSRETGLGHVPSACMAPPHQPASPCHVPSARIAPPNQPRERVRTGASSPSAPARAPRQPVATADRV
jgi:hypothetical protein